MPTKKILLCATDAGGARNLSPLVRVIIDKEYQPILVTSRGMLFLFDSKGVEFIESSKVTCQSAEDFLNTVMPAAIICGTSRYVSAERLLIAAGRKLGIGTVVVLDEWFNYRVRFENETGELIYLPDAIAAMDELAKKEAIKEGIPQERIYITGNPSLAALTDQAYRFVANPPPMPEFTTASSIITFLSETHAIDYGSKPGERGPMGSYLGYTENTVRDNILAMLENIDQPCTFVEKLHPSTREGNLDIIYREKIRWIRVKKMDLWTLLWHSELIVGMRSMALLEAKILGRPAVVSYQPGLLRENYCSAVRLGLIPMLSTTVELEQWCQSHLAQNRMGVKRVLQRFPFAREDASENVIRLALTVGGLQ